MISKNIISKIRVESAFAISKRGLDYQSNIYALKKEDSPKYNIYVIFTGEYKGGKKIPRTEVNMSYDSIMYLLKIGM